LVTKGNNMTFNQWLFKQGERNDVVGDLAHDASRDRRWPTGQRAQEDYLESMHACDGAKEALLEAWQEYYEQVKP
jgi:hypothetical protein